MDTRRIRVPFRIAIVGAIVGIVVVSEPFIHGAYAGSEARARIPAGDEWAGVSAS